MPFLERLRFKFNNNYIPEPFSGCWLWTGTINGRNYGSIGFESKTMAAHRISAMLFLNFDIDNNLQILHKCDNTLCVNPNHLFIGTTYDNIRDRVSKGRSVSHNTSKIHCPSGHEYTPENTIVNSEGKRKCKTCVYKRNQVDRDIRRAVCL